MIGVRVRSGFRVNISIRVITILMAPSITDAGAKHLLVCINVSSNISD